VETARILDEIAEKLKSNGLGAGNLLDINGNFIGRVKITGR